MKAVIITVDDAKKTELAGADKLTKSDLIVLVSQKAKSEMPKAVSEALDELACGYEYCKVDSASEIGAAYAYYAAYHDAKGHDTFIVATDKAKVSKLAAKSAKVYTAFKSIIGSSSTGKSSSSSKKKTSSSSTSGKKKTASSSSKKKTSSSGKKKTDQKKDESTLSSILNSPETKKLINVAKKALKEATKDN